MVPPVFIVAATLPWLFAGRCAAAYWQIVAEVLAAPGQGGADVVALPPAAPMRRRLPRDHVADLIPLIPKRS